MPFDSNSLMTFPHRRFEKREVLLVLAVVLFVLAWPLEKRHLIYTEYSFITGAYTETGTLALYVSDLAFVLLGLAWVWWKAKAGTTWPLSVPRSVFWLGSALVAWAAVRALPLHPSLLGWYAAGRIAQGFLLLLVVADLWRFPKARNAALWSLIVGGVLQSLLGISQVSRSSDLGLRLLGEPPLSLAAPGVAKVDVLPQSGTEVNVPTGTKVLRAYGTFPHPNVLGWFLVASLAAGSSLFLSSKFREGVFRGPSKHYERLALFLAEHRSVSTVIHGVITAGILVTFSRVAWLGFALLAAGFAPFTRRRLDKSVLSFIAIGTLLGIGVPLLLDPRVFLAVSSRIRPPETDMFLQERSSSYVESIHATKGSFVAGVGSGGGILYLARNKRNIDSIYTSGYKIEEDVPIGTRREPWSFQYPHNVLLVILLELGIVGLGLFLTLCSILFLRYVVKHGTPRSASPRGVGVLLVFAAFLLPLLVDHFPWTIQQGRILIWGLLGVVAAAGMKNEG